MDQETGLVAPGALNYVQRFMNIDDIRNFRIDWLSSAECIAASRLGLGGGAGHACLARGGAGHWMSRLARAGQVGRREKITGAALEKVEH